MLVRPATREYRTWILDSRRWQDYRPRPDDIILASYPKSGSTWMLRILDLLVFQSAAPRSLDKLSPWVDRRFPVAADAMWADLDSRDHRRILKSHLPLDGLPFHDGVKYIHIARDGRDVCLSYHHHITGFKEQTLDMLDREGLADDTIGMPYPRISPDPAAYFQFWLTQGAIAGQNDGSPFLSYFELERSYWDARGRPNILFVHYNDLKQGLGAQMRRIAAFLGISLDEALLPELVQAAQFEAMRRDGGNLVPKVSAMFEGGAQRFFNKGTNRRWQGVFRPEDLTLYDARLADALSPDAAQWLTGGTPPAAR